MKKRFLPIVALFAAAAITPVASCGKKKPTETTPAPTETDPTAEFKEMVAAAIAALKVDATVTDDFTLTVKGAGNVAITWASNNDAIKIDGAQATVTRPGINTEDVTVTLTATAAFQGVTETKTFTVKVPAVQDQSKTVATIKETEKSTLVDAKGVITGFLYKADGDVESRNGYYLTDSTGTIYVFDSATAADVEVGYEVYLSGQVDEYSGAKQISKVTGCTILNKTATTDWTAVTKLANNDAIQAVYDAYLNGEKTGGEVYEMTTMIYKNNFGGYVLECADYPTHSASFNIYLSGSATEAMTKFNEGLKGNEGDLVKVKFVVNSVNSSKKPRGNILEIIPFTAEEAKTILTEKASKLITLNPRYKEADNGTKITLPTTVAANYPAGTTIEWSLKEGSTGAALNEAKNEVTISVNETRQSFTLVATIKIPGVEEAITGEYTAETKNSFEPMTVAQVLALNDDVDIDIKGVVTGFYYKNVEDAETPIAFYLTDSTGTVVIYDATLAASVAKGQELILAGKKGSYYGAPQITEATLTEKTSDAATADWTAVTKLADDEAFKAEVDKYKAGTLKGGVVYEFLAKVGKNSSKVAILKPVSDEVDALFNIYFSGTVKDTFTKYNEGIADKDGQLVRVRFMCISANSSGTPRGTVLSVLPFENGDKVYLAENVVRSQVQLQSRYVATSEGKEITLPAALTGDCDGVTVTWSLKEGSAGAAIADGKLTITPTDAKQSFTLIATCTIPNVTEPVVVTYDEVVTKTSFDPLTPEAFDAAATKTAAKYTQCTASSVFNAETTYYKKSSSTYTAQSSLTEETFNAAKTTYYTLESEAVEGATVMVGGVITDVGEVSEKKVAYITGAEGRGYYIYEFDTEGLAVGDYILVEGLKDQYNGLIEITGATLVEKKAGTPVAAEVNDAITVDYIKTTANLNKYVSFNGVVKTANTITVGEQTITLSRSTDLPKDANVKVIGYCAINGTSAKITVFKDSDIVCTDTEALQASYAKASINALLPAEEVDYKADIDLSKYVLDDKVTYTVSGAEGSVVFNADTKTLSITPDATAHAVELTFTFTCGAATDTLVKTINTAAVEGAVPVKADIIIKDIADANNWANSTQYTSATLVDGAVTATAKNGSNTGKYYTTNSSWRIYEASTGTLTITAAEGKTIKSVTLVYANANSGVAVVNSTNYTSGSKITVNAQSVDITVAHTSGTSNGIIQITEIIVIYA